MLGVLRRAQQLGFLGPAPVEVHLRHSLAFLDVWKEDPVAQGEVGTEQTEQTGVTGQTGQTGLTDLRGLTDAGADGVGRALDLGSGGGVPGLVLAWHRPQTRWTLLDGSERRGAFLVEAVADLGLSGSVDVLSERAETTGRGPLRHTQDLVVARGFAGPAVTAECAAPLLVVGGRLVVSEPPGGAPARWPAEALSELGLVPHRAVRSPVALQVLRQTELCPDRYPRRVGVPGKRPLF